MDKQKIDLAKYADLCEEVQVKGKDGTVVTVRTHIPYSEKVALAQEWIEQTLMVHDDSCVYMSYESDLYRKYYIAKYYTDVDVEDATPEEVYNFMINNELYDDVNDRIMHDFDDVVMMYYAIYENYRDTYNDDRSLAKAVRTSFGFLFNGEDITESMAKAEMTKETIYKAFSALQEKEKAESTQLSDGGKLKVNGNILQFGKKKV